MQYRRLPWMLCLLALAPSVHATEPRAEPVVRLPLSQSHAFQRPKDLQPGSSLKPKLPAPMPSPVVLETRAQRDPEGRVEMVCDEAAHAPAGLEQPQEVH